MNDEQISQDSWNKYPTIVDLYCALELKDYVDAGSCIPAETVEITGKMGSSAEKANNSFSEKEQIISSHC